MKLSKLTRVVIFTVLLISILLFAFISGCKTDVVQSQTRNNGVNGDTKFVESISDEAIPMAAPAAVKVDAQDDVVLLQQAYEKDVTVRTIARGTETPKTPEPIATPMVAAPKAEPATPTPEPATPTPEPATPTPEPATPTPEPATPTPTEVTPTPKPAKAQKPTDISDVTSMAKFIFDAATEFWAVEKDFSGTTTRPVSTRVAASIGAGTAVDCPGGDTVRVDKNGVEHDSYAIADHFRDYVEMPDLQYFKIYLSDKDYTVNPYGAREEVIGSYYQYGSERANYAPEEEAPDEPGTVAP